jgi:hypothetical protein
MPGSAGDRKSNRRRPQFVVILIVVVFFGLHGIYRVTQSETFESFRTLDVVQLVVSGDCFGAAFVGLMFKLLRPHI